MISHQCDFAGCTNPAHMRLGTNATNRFEYLTRRRNLANPLADVRGAAGRARAIAAAIRAGLELREDAASIENRIPCRRNRGPSANTLVIRVPERPAQEVFTAERARLACCNWLFVPVDIFQEPLNRPQHRRAAFDVIDQDESSTWSQYPRHFGDGPGVVGDGAGPERADDGVEGGVVERRPGFPITG